MMRIVPSAQHADQTPAVVSSNAVLGVHDTLRNPHSSIASKINSSHPLETRLNEWSNTQFSMRLESMRRIYGSAEPIRREMELSLSRDDFGKGIGWDILRGSDTMITESDFMIQSEADTETIQEMITRKVGK